MEQLTFFAEEHPAKVSASPDFAKDLLTSAATSHLNLYGWLRGFAPSGWFGKMSPVFCRLTKEGIFLPSSEGWQNAGMGSHTGFLTLNISECHSGADVCSLSDILETGNLPQRYFLSMKACMGIIRRTDRNKKWGVLHLHSQSEDMEVAEAEKFKYFAKMAQLESQHQRK